MVIPLTRYLSTSPNSLRGHRSELTCVGERRCPDGTTSPKPADTMHKKAVRRRQLKSNTRALSAKFSQWTPGVATATDITAAGVVI